MTAIAAPPSVAVPPEVAEALIHATASSSEIPVVVTDGAAVLWANLAAGTLLRHETRALEGLPLRRILPSLDDAALRLLLRTSRTAKLDTEVRTAVGESIPITAVAAPSPAGAVWTVRLVQHDREDALASLAAAHERRFSVLTERSPVPTLLSECGLRIEHVNDAAASLLGLPAERLTGTGWIEHLHPEDYDAVVDAAMHALNGDNGEANARLLTATGERTTVMRFSHLATPRGESGFVATVEDVTERLAFEARLRYEATHDRLTGLPNRAQLDERIADLFRAGESSLACVFLDLDNFKMVNDSLGHPAGDALLVEVARRIRGAVRPEDLVVRFGGDEFIIVCDGITEAGAAALAERILAHLTEVVTLDNVEVVPQGSIGVTAQTADHATAEELIRDCDIAMYEAKTGGKGRVTVFGAAAREAARSKLRLVAALREALTEETITVAFQPVVNASDGSLRAVEALARWTLDGEAVSPDRFIPAAEESGQIKRLGELVLRRSLEQLAAWDARLGVGAVPVVNVNVSAHQLADPGLQRVVELGLLTNGLASSRLCVEITESSLMGDPVASRAVLDGLRAIGVRTAIDDFGTGYSSLAHLRQLPVHCLKVDKSFVAELADGHGEITRAVIALAHSLGLTAVAEGVEDEATAEQLRAIGCDALQGWHTGRPVDGNTIEEMLR